MGNGSGVATIDTLAPTPTVKRRRGERLFFSGMSVAIALTVVAGFAPSYFLRGASGFPPLSPLLHVHGALFTGWILLLLVQTSLVAANQTRVHRRLGVGGGVLAAAMVVAGYMAAIDAARRGSSIPPMSAHAFLAIPMMDMVVFPAFVGTALALRRRTDIHKRLILLATIDLASAAIARLPFIAPYGALGFFGVSDLLIVALAAYDLATLGRIHRATLWGGLILVASQIVRVMMADTSAWLAVAQWLTR